MDKLKTLALVAALIVLGCGRRGYQAGPGDRAQLRSGTVPAQFNVAPVENPDTVPGPPDTTGLDTVPLDTTPLQAESALLSESLQAFPPNFNPDSIPGPPDTTMNLDTFPPDTSMLQESETLFAPESVFPESIPPESIGTE